MSDQVEQELIASLKAADAKARRTLRGSPWLVFTRGREGGYEWRLVLIEFEGERWADRAFEKHKRRTDGYVGLLAPDGSVRAFRG